MKKNLLLVMLAIITCFVGAKADELVVADGENTNQYLPVMGNYCDTEGTYGYMIYPKEDLQEIAGGEISGLTFHLQAMMSTNNAGCVMQMSLKEIDDATIPSSSTVYNDLTVCGTYTIVGGETTLPFAFAQNFPYSGDKNLLVEVKVITASAGYATFYTYGVRQTAGVNTGLSFYSTYGTLQNFLPKATIEFASEPVEWGAKVTPAGLNFGKLNNGEDSTLYINIVNKGMNAFTPTFDVKAPFSIDWTAPIAAGATAQVPVKFAPETDGNYKDTVVVNCGEAGTYKVGLEGRSIEAGSEIIVCDGTNQNGYIPVYGSYYDTQGTTSQFIYPAEMLTELNGRAITSVKFFAKSAILIKNGKLQLSVKEVDYTTFERESATSVPSNKVSDMTVVATIVPTGDGTEMEFVFDEPFTYNGGNLAFETYVVEKNNYSTITWLGKTQANDCAYYEYTSSWGGTTCNVAQFLPKMQMNSIAAGEQPAQGITLAEMLTTGENGAEYTISDDLAVADVAQIENHAFLTDGQNNWIRVDFNSDIEDFVLMDAIKGGTLKGTLSNVELNPVLTVTTMPEEGETPVEYTVEEINLADPFETLKSNQVVKVTGYWNATENTLRGYSGENNGIQGQSMSLNTTWAAPENTLENGKSYQVLCAITLKEAWKPATTGISLMDYDYDFQNYLAYALVMPNTTTGIDSINLNNVKTVRYYNVAGIESATPFQGVNIVVMEMNDGSKKTMKVVK